MIPYFPLLFFSLIAHSELLKAGVDIIVGTPNKLSALVENKSLDLSQIRFYVLDEADALVSGSFYDDVRMYFINFRFYHYH